ncbi:hypothetical protein D3C79_734490 [compost metagenome]
MSQAVSALGRRLQCVTPNLWLIRTQAQLNPGLERCQRRAQLMGGLSNELGLTLELAAQAFGEMVQGTHQRAQFTLHLDQRQGPQVIGLTFFHGAAQTLQRTQRGTDRKPHQH